MSNVQFIETQGSIGDQPMEGEILDVEVSQVETPQIVAAKAALAEAKRQLALAQGKEPKQRKKLNFETVFINGNVDKAKLQALQLAYPDYTKTQLLRFMLDFALGIENQKED
jgi:hypothetical protein